MTHISNQATPGVPELDKSLNGFRFRTKKKHLDETHFGPSQRLLARTYPGWSTSWWRETLWKGREEEWERECSVCVCVWERERERERENIFSNKKVHSLGQKVYSYGRRRKKSFQNIFLYFPPFSFFHTFFVEISEKTSNRRLKEGKIITLKQSFMTWQVSGIGVTVRLVHSGIGVHSSNLTLNFFLPPV